MDHTENTVNIFQFFIPHPGLIPERNADSGHTVDRSFNILTAAERFDDSIYKFFIIHWSLVIS